MGLDNGIVIRRETAPDNASKIFNEQEWAKKYEFIEVAYWRKCWNVRQVILDTLYQIFIDEYRVSMSFEDLNNVICSLKKMKKSNWCDYGGCIWEWKEFKSIQKRNIKALKKLRRLMKKYDHIEVYFYDSY